MNMALGIVYYLVLSDLYKTLSLKMVAIKGNNDILTNLLSRTIGSVLLATFPWSVEQFSGLKWG